MNDTDSNLAQWKRKVLELEQQQEAHSADFELLNRLALRFCVALRGQDRELDQQLPSLQDALKRAPADREFRRLASSMEKAVMPAFQRRDQQVRRSADILRNLLSELGERLVDPEAGERLDSLLAELPDLLENFYDYPRVFEQTLVLQRSAFAADDAAPRSATIGDPEEDTDLNSTSEEDDRDLMCRRLAALLLDLIGQLSIPPAEMPKAHALLHQIESGFGWHQLEAILQETVDLIVTVAVLGHAEFEGYLENINGQLSDIHSFLHESREDQRQSHDSSQQLDKAVRTDVIKMERSLQSAATLEQLKQSVRSQLGDIVKAMDRYRGELEARELRVEQRLVELQGKLESMEEQSKQVHKHLEEQRLRALSDPLTLLPNRAAYDERVQQEFARWSRYAGDLTMVLCDLDHFKQVNDNYGHLAGDKVLRIVAKILARGIRETDFVARIGGEEFVILMPETDTDRALLVMNKLRETVARSPFNFKGQPVRVTMSFGVTSFGAKDEVETVFERADQALYEAKHKGRDCVVVVDS